jgi:hypothetical protein
MAFLPSSSTKTLYAYLTQKGREYVLSGDKTQFAISQFSLHDDDVNYEIAKNLVNSEYNKLPKGFVPDITGDNEDCINSIALGIYARPNCTITGDTSGLLKQTRDVYVGFENTTFNAPAPTNTSQNSFSQSITVLLRPPDGDPIAITNEEISNARLFIVVNTASIAITNVKINGIANQSPSLAFTNSPSLTITLTFDKNTTIATANDRTIDSKIELQIVTAEGALVSAGFNKFTYTIPLTIKGTGSSSSQGR